LSQTLAIKINGKNDARYIKQSHFKAFFEECGIKEPMIKDIVTDFKVKLKSSIDLIQDIATTAQEKKFLNQIHAQFVRSIQAF